MEFLEKTVDSKYEICNKIGEGTHGMIFKIRKEETSSSDIAKQYFAIKIPKRSEDENASCEANQYLNNEIDILRKLRHRNIVKIFDFERDKYMVMELYKTNVKASKIRTHEFVMFIGSSILSALEYLHISRKIVYRDLKPENILLISARNKIAKAVLSDFGMAMEFSTHSINRLSRFIQGTPIYASINCHRGKSVCPTDDLENLIYVLIDLDTGTLPWKEDPNATDKCSPSFNNNSILLSKTTAKKEEFIHNDTLACMYEYIIKINKSNSSYVKINSNLRELKKVYNNLNKIISNIPFSYSEPLLSQSIEIVQTKQPSFLQKAFSIIKKIFCCHSSSSP